MRLNIFRKVKEIWKRPEEQDVYSREGREELVENDELSPEEAGFMEGAELDGQHAKCRKCGKILFDDIVETEIDTEIHRFCSQKCADKFKKNLG